MNANHDIGACEPADILFTPSSQWPKAGTCDVLVVGAGPAGIAAAVAAARGDARTILIDGAGAPGGVATSANCPHLMGFAHDGRQIAGGIADEFVRILDRLGAARLRGPDARPLPGPIGSQPLTGNVISSVPGIRAAAYRMLLAAGVECRMYTRLIGAMASDGAVEAAAVDRAEGPALILAKAFVDATGDAHLVHRAGGEVREADPLDSMTKTLLFDMAGVRNFDREKANEIIRRESAAGRLPVPLLNHFMGYETLLPGVVLCNFTAVAGDALRSESLTEMDRELREQVLAAAEWFRRSVPGFENAAVCRDADVVGLRAGRTGVGIETITVADIEENRPVAEPAALGRRILGSAAHSAGAGRPRGQAGGLRPIPWRSLISRSFRNVALAGRALSADVDVLSSVRLIAQCMATGQAAGTTAALSSRNGGNLEGVGYDGVREALEAAGAILVPPG